MSPTYVAVRSSYFNDQDDATPTLKTKPDDENINWPEAIPFVELKGQHLNIFINKSPSSLSDYTVIGPDDWLSYEAVMSAIRPENLNDMQSVTREGWVTLDREYGMTVVPFDHLNQNSIYD